MNYVLILQNLSTEQEAHRGLSTTSDWFCYSTTSWLFC